MIWMSPLKGMKQLSSDCRDHKDIHRWATHPKDATDPGPESSRVKDIADCNIHFKLQHTLNQTTRPSQIGMLYEVIEMATHLIWVYIIY